MSHTATEETIQAAYAASFREGPVRVTLDPERADLGDASPTFEALVIGVNVERDELWVREPGKTDEFPVQLSAVTALTWLSEPAPQADSLF
jgi:hypothetical protein